MKLPIKPKLNLKELETITDLMAHNIDIIKSDIEKIQNCQDWTNEEKEKWTKEDKQEILELNVLLTKLLKISNWGKI
tara:strand:+ start:2820 stop:3050 length:231 start_codon:yes stop_codon:yes gene_type:complete